ncbi:MAG: MBL fold metallo-hydrolase [Candidatus Lokiarchaeota archaeon]|nr:MBL fold metallo-hydrolase [Candidatus Lokiarchaeota archaeon]
MVQVENIRPGLDIIKIKNLGTNSAYVIRGSKKKIVVESGFPSELKSLKNGFNKLGLDPKDIDYFATTHVHLDHCGAAGQLADMNSELKVFAHEKGVEHLINPERLNESAERAYGTRAFPMIGKLLPVPEHQIIPLKEGDEIDLGNISLKTFYTPGHAKHHVCFFIEKDGILFTGDLLGKIHAQILAKQDYPIIVTPPPDYDQPTILKSITRMEELDPKLLLFTHMGPAPPKLNQNIFNKVREQHVLFVNEIRNILKEFGTELDGKQIIEKLQERILMVKRFPENFNSFRMGCNGIKRYLIKNGLL